MKFRNLVIFILTIICMLVYSCSLNCDKKMDEVRAKHGSPEETSKYSSAGYYSETWWYWSKGVSYTFTWGAKVTGACDFSKYEFDPISADATAEQKAAITTVLINRQISLKGIY